MLFQIPNRTFLFNLVKLRRNSFGNILLNSFRSNQTNTVEHKHGVTDGLVPSRRLNSDIYFLNKDGSLDFQSGPFDRVEICEKYSLEARDLPKIDTDIPINVPLIDVRHGKFVCFSFRRHRSLIQANRAIFFVPSAEKVRHEESEKRDSINWSYLTHVYATNVKILHQNYTQRLQMVHSNQLPFEFHLIEISLELISSYLRTKSYKLFQEFEDVRERSYNRITVLTLRELALLKERADRHKRNGDLAHKSILDVLSNDEDLIGMYLTDNRPRNISDHVQIEFLLESSSKQMAEVCRSTTDLADSIKTLENAIGFILDAVRNELLAFEIRINIVTMGLGFGALVAGIYGMNVSHGLEQEPYAFYMIGGASLLGITSIIGFTMKRLLRYRKIRLHRQNKLKVF